MATKSKSTRNHGSSEEQRPLTEMADTARKNYEQAIRTGQKFQEEAGQWWARMLTQTATATDWQRNFSRLTTMAGGVMPIAQRCLEGAITVMEKSGRSSTEVMKKAIEAAQTSNLAEGQAKWAEFWTTSMKAAQSNVEAVTHLGTSTLDCWVDFIRKSTEFDEMASSRSA